MHPTLLSSCKTSREAKYQHEGVQIRVLPERGLRGDQNWNEDIDAVKGRNDDLTAMVRMRYNLFRGGSDLAESKATSALYSQAKDIHLNAFRQVEEDSSGLECQGVAGQAESLPERARGRQL